MYFFLPLGLSHSCLCSESITLKCWVPHFSTWLQATLTEASLLPEHHHGGEWPPQMSTQEVPERTQMWRNSEARGTLGHTMHP